jgi:hypothetical protein
MTQPELTILQSKPEYILNTQDNNIHVYVMFATSCWNTNSFSFWNYFVLICFMRKQGLHKGVTVYMHSLKYTGNVAILYLTNALSTSAHRSKISARIVCIIFFLWSCTFITPRDISEFRRPHVRFNKGHGRKSTNSKLILIQKFNNISCTSSDQVFLSHTLKF